MTKGIWIYGSVPPEPNGGVCVFIERLIRSGSVPIDGLIDPYYGRKNPIGVTHIVPSKPGVWAKARTLGRIRALRDKPLMVNASTARAITRLFPFVRKRNAPTVLILHHGNLGDPAKMPASRRALLRRLLCQYDRIGFLSEAQEAFYVGLGVTSPRLTAVDIYLPQARSSDDHVSALLRSVLDWINADHRPLAIGSGWANEYYHHDWPLEALSREGSPFRYLVCCYGEKTAELERLRERFESTSDAMIVYGLSPSEFDFVLDHGNVYVRPFAVESFGIAVRDAGAKGLQIVASDACDRPAGFIHRTGDKADFLDKLEEALSCVAAGHARTAKVAPSRGQGIADFLQEALLQARAPA